MKQNKNLKKGSALLIAMLVAVSVGTMAVSYFRYSRITAKNQIRTINKDVIREISQMATDEIFARTFKDAGDIKTKIFWFLKGSAPGSTYRVDTPFTKENSKNFLSEGYSCEVGGRIRIVKFRKTAPNNSKYYGSYEGHGIIAIETKALLYRHTGEKRSVAFSHEIETHFDYFLVSTVCMSENGSMMINPLVVRKDREAGNTNVIKGDNAAVLTLHNTMNSFQPVIPDSFVLYDKYSLWSKRNLSIDDLYRYEIIDQKTKTLNLNGIVHCKDSVTIEGDYKVVGQGVIIADSFNINGGIEKSDNTSLCVLYANKGKIVTNTENVINAALIASNRNFTGTLEALKALKINGLLLVDTLDLNAWAEKEHQIHYDTDFKDDGKANRAVISKWVTYRRTNEKI
ncbi:MAG: hypothetical protein PHF29_08690 [Candidatus Riflebacteria bacterium]|nr:hypothetical protein [Candidatus Riflebacteria bacterium]